VQRLIEQPREDGDVWEGASLLGRVHYHLDVYQHFSEIEGEPVPASLGVEGHIAPFDPLDLAALQRRHADLTLKLADGRTLEFRVASADGAIRSTGRGLYTAVAT
jgi:hypothetical protein